MTSKANSHRPEVMNGADKKSSQPVQANAASTTPVTVDGDVEKTLSGAELKKRAKAEKAAKRAQAKQDQTPPVLQDLKASKKVDHAAEVGKKPGQNTVPAMSGAKGQIKRSESLSKAIPSRPAQEPAGKVLPLVKESKKVALFGHLDGQPRRNTIAGAGKDVHPAVLALGLQMSNYVICGSSARCVAMLLAFKRVVESYTTPPGNSLPRHLTSHLSSQIDYMISCRPLSTSMGNAIRWVKLRINKVDPDTPEAIAKADLCEDIDNFIRERITIADQVIAENAAEKIKDGDVILTFAKSHIVQQALVKAYHQGRKFRVIVVDSRPLFEGRNLALALADVGLHVEYSLTYAISHSIKHATKVFLGAHSMMSNGRLYSRAGTAIVAMMAKDADVPVIVCCESIKFTDKVALDSIVTNEVAPPDELVLQGRSSTTLSIWQDLSNLQLLNLMYDLTPAEYVAMVITEYGPLPPSSVPVVHALSTMNDER